MPKPDPSRCRRGAAAAVVFNDEGLLLLHRRTDNGLWALPGGTMETGETAEQTVVREVWEETGYHIEVTRLVGIYSHPAQTTVTYADGNTVAYVSLLFEGRLSGGTPTLCDETSEIGWFAPTELPEPFLAGHRPRVHDALAGQVAAFFR